jgi:sterol 3beta-glucosyltransferase
MSPSSPPTASAQTSHDDRAVRRVSRKLQKKRRDGEHTPTMELPERLKDHGDQADNEEEVLRPQGYGGGMFMNMNQSIFGLIAAAGSQADFADRFEGQSSDEDDESESAMAKTVAGPKALGPVSSAAQSLAQTTVLLRHGAARLKHEGRHRKKLAESRLLRSVPGLARITDKMKSSKSAKAKSDAHVQMHPNDAEDTGAPPPTDLAPSIEITRTESRTAPVMSRMLEARAEMAARPSFDLARLTDEPSRISDATEGPTELAKRLKDIFEFDRPEEVIEEYPCWLLQHVLLQGYLYITARHIAFYAYLPKKAVSGPATGALVAS